MYTLSLEENISTFLTGLPAGCPCGQSDSPAEDVHVSVPLSLSLFITKRILFADIWITGPLENYKILTSRNEISAYNPLWWAILVSKCQEMEKRTKKQKKTKCQDMNRHPPFRWVSIWGIFYCKTGSFFEIFDPNVPTRRG